MCLKYRPILLKMYIRFKSMLSSSAYIVGGRRPSSFKIFFYASGVVHVIIS